MNCRSTRFWRRVVALGCALLAVGGAAGAAPERVTLETNDGVIELELDADKAPVTVANFLQYVDDGFYDGLIFHRVLANFVIQAGGFDAAMKHREPRPPIVNESQNGLRNTKGTIAMARQNEPDSAAAQFFINVKNNPNLNFRPGAPGYTVFGRVVSGMDIVERIELTPTHVVDEMVGVPIEPVIIIKARRIKP